MGMFRFEVAAWLSELDPLGRLGCDGSCPATEGAAASLDGAASPGTLQRRFRFRVCRDCLFAARRLRFPGLFGVSAMLSQFRRPNRPQKNGISIGSRLLG